MQHSAIYDPRANLTQSQAEAEKARRERLEKIAGRARPDTPISCQSVSGCLGTPPDEPANAPVVSFEEWAARQILINTPPKPTWFAIEAEIEPPEPARPKVEDIQRAVAKHYGVRRSDILSQRRTANIVRPRQVAAYLSKKLTLRSLPEIGRRTGMRDHTTILSSVRKIARILETEPGLSDTINEIEREILDAHR